MILENGNPFDRLHFEGDTLVTTDSTERFEEGWVIPINEPWEISYWKKTLQDAGLVDRKGEIKEFH